MDDLHSPYDGWVTTSAALKDGKPTADDGKGSTDSGKGSTDDGTSSGGGGGGFDLGGFLDAAGDVWEAGEDFFGGGSGDGGGSSSTTTTTGSIPSQRPASDKGISEATAQDWLTKARNGLGLVPGPERYAAYIFLQHPDDPAAGFGRLADYNRLTPRRADVLACLWDLYQLADVPLTSGGGLGRRPVPTGELRPGDVRNDLNRDREDDSGSGTGALIVGLALGLGGLILFRTWL